MSLQANLPNLRAVHALHDRAIGDWVLKKGGSIELIQGETVSRVEPRAKPPNEVFRLVGANLPGNPAIDDAAAETLRDALILRRLDLSDTSITDASSAWIGGLGELESVDLNRTKLSDQSMPALARLSRLRRLSLIGNSITAKGLDHIAKLENLKHLAVAGATLDRDALALIARLKNLESLVLDDGLKVTPGSLAPLAELANLQSLSLPGARFAPNSTGAIRNFKALKVLNLVKSDVSDDDLRSIAEMPRLEELTLGARVTDKGLAPLEKMPNLRALAFEGSNITRAAAERLERALPKCKIAFNGVAPTK